MTGEAGESVEVPAERATLQLRLVLGLATALMVGLSWPLWDGSGDIPRVPFLAALPSRPAVPDGATASAIVAAVLLTAVAGRRWRGWFVLSLGLFAWLILQDQHRFQPWAYQYLATGLLLAALPGVEALWSARLWFAALYLHSGLSKLDASFCNELGPVFLRTAVGPLGLDPLLWPAPARLVAVLAMPVGEIAVASALLFPRTRRLGRLGAVCLHAALLGVLGPAGLGHSAIVLLWNAAVLVEVWVAFGPDLARPTGPTHRAWLVWPVRAAFWAGLLLPFGERWGVWDAWPSHALYASHVERVTVLLHESELGGYPLAVRDHVLPADGPWRVLDLTGWSRGVRGTPVYPQNRACLGLAEGLSARQGSGLVRVAVFGAADRWTGRRRLDQGVGLVEIRRLGARFRLNAHPAGRPGSAGSPRR